MTPREAVAAVVLLLTAVVAVTLGSCLATARADMEVSDGQRTIRGHPAGDSQHTYHRPDRDRDRGAGDGDSGDDSEIPAGQDDRPLVVTHLNGPAVPVDHPDAERYLALEPWLTEAVWRVAWCESRFRTHATRTDAVAGRPYTSYGILQNLVDGATGPMLDERGGTPVDLFEPLNALEFSREWARQTDRGVPFRLWSCR